MRLTLAILVFLAAVFCVGVGPLSAASDEIGIDEHLGQTIPLDLAFKDESGAPVLLRDLVTGPTIFVFVYYECPGLCTPLLASLASLVDRVDARAGTDYRIVTVSFDETNTPELAREKKANYLHSLARPIPEDSWRFLTGEPAAIQALTSAVGFSFKREGKDFIHTAALIVSSREGKIVRYLYGSNSAGGSPASSLRFLPFDFKMALVEASAGRVGPTIGRVLKYCFSYDPAGRRYVLDITRVAAVLVTLFGGGYFVYLVSTRRKVPG